MNDLRHMHRIEKERHRAQERELKKIRRYAVVLHSGGSGYVVRSGDILPDGRLWIPQPYSDVDPVGVYKSEKLAQRAADKLNNEVAW